MPSVAVIPGDGIGPEVTREAVAVLAALDIGLEFEEYSHLNADTYLSEGRTLTGEDLDDLRRTSGILFGAVGDPRVTTPDYARGLLLPIRHDLDLYVNLRPARLLDRRLSPLRDERRSAMDCVVVRENTEGLYVGLGGAFRAGTPDEVAIDEDISTYKGTMRILRYAFSIARRGVCLVDKSNAVRFGGRVWQRCWQEVKDEHPDVATRHLYVDTAAMKLVEDPSSFDVVVTNNSYGDILSDLTAQLAGGLGTAASANLNPEEGLGLFEPVHGSAPDIAGRSMANPVGAILSAALLLRHLGRSGEAEAVEHGVRTSVESRRCTPDLGGELTTEEAGAAIRQALAS